jgi:hypothetical protein
MTSTRKSCIASLLFFLAVSLQACSGSNGAPRHEETGALTSPLLESTLLVGSSAMRHDGRSTIVTTTRGSGGLRMMFDLDPSRRYELTLKGRTVSGRAALRVVRDGKSTLEPHRAPSGEWKDTVERTRQLQVSIYSIRPDRTMEYELDEVSLLECEKCSTATDLKREVLDAIPGLETLVRTDHLEASVAILRWVAPRIDWSLSPELVRPSTEVFANVGAAYYRIFEPSQEGVFCGGAAMFFNSVLRLFDIPSAVIDFGGPGDWTHVTVLVARQGPGGADFYIVDPTFNAVFVDGTGRMVDVERLIRLHRGRRFEDVRLAEAPLITRDWLLARTADPRVVSACEQVVSTNDRAVVCRHPKFDYAEYLRMNEPAIRTADVPYGPAMLVAMLQRRIFTGGDFVDAQYTTAFRQLREQHHIPFGHPPASASKPGT